MSVTDGDAHNKERLTVKYPTDGWSTSLEKMPMFTRAEMNEHIARSGKNISDIQNHSVPTSLRKAKTFLEDEYLREINAASDDCCFYFQAKCCHSFRKNDAPYQLKIALCIFKGDVLDNSCTCVPGKAGFGVTGAKWCDFIAYTSKGIYIERIAFDPAYWENLKTELLRYYFEHFLKFASADFNSSA